MCSFLDDINEWPLRKKKLKSNSLNNSNLFEIVFYIFYLIHILATFYLIDLWKIPWSIDWPKFCFSYIEYIYIGWTELFYWNSEKNSDRRSQIKVYFIRNSGRKRKAFMSLQEFRPEKTDPFAILYLLSSMQKIWQSWRTKTT